VYVGVFLANLTITGQIGGVSMAQADTPSSPVDVSTFKYVVGVDIGSQTGSLCVLRPDKSQILKPTDFANPMPGLRLLLTKLEQLGVPPAQILRGLEATSRYGENLYQFLESQGYQLCLLHPRHTHEFAQRRGLRAKTDKLDATTIARVAASWRRPSWLCSQRTDCHIPGAGALAYAAGR